MNLESDYYHLQGTIRSTTPENTLQWLKPLLPKLGITRVANITGLDNIGLPVATCIRPMAHHLSVSQGKGLSLTLAKISAIMEAVESFHQENPPEAVIHGNYCSLQQQGYAVVDPTTFPASFFNPPQTTLHSIFLPWIKAESLVSGKEILIPQALANINSSFSRPEFSYFLISSNGMAAGNSKKEATCHALYEVIERDVFYQWGKLSLDARNDTLLDINSIHSPVIRELIAQIKKAHLDIKIWDISSILGIPSFHCGIYNKDIYSPLGFFSGTGTHLDQKIALSRAITEAVQARAALISGNRDDVFPEYYYQQKQLSLSVLKNPIENGKKPLDKCPKIHFEESFSSNVKQLSTILQKRGYEEIFIVDHTKSEVGIPVMQTIIPKMHFTGARM